MNVSRPNIIFVLCDQFRGDCLGVAGHPVVQTPNLDYLATHGTYFSRAYSAVPSCLPARAILWSGQDQWHTGILGMGPGQGEIPNDFCHTIPGELSAAGYRTHLVGKGHFWPQRTSMGFQSSELDESGRMPDSDHRRWFAAHAPEDVTPDDHGVYWNSWHARPWHAEEHLHPTAWTMARALDFLDREADRGPFFLNISFARPHSPYVPPRWYFDLYDQGTVPEPVVGDWAEAMHGDPDAGSDPNAWHGRLSPEQVRRARAGYLGEISFIDCQVGRLLNWLEQHPRFKTNTWIIFSADHGDMQGDHYLWRKTYGYEGSARIPMIVTPPLGCAASARRRAGEPVELRDLMPTILGMAGLAVPPTAEGRSLLPLLEATPDSWRDCIHGEHCTCYAPEQEMQYLTDGRRKYIWLPRIGCEQFFDLEADPGECLDLSADPERADEVARWRAQLVKFLKARDCGWTDGHKLQTPPDEPLVSPWRDCRWTANTMEQRMDQNG